VGDRQLGNGVDSQQRAGVDQTKEMVVVEERVVMLKIEIVDFTRNTCRFIG